MNIKYVSPHDLCALWDVFVQDDAGEREYRHQSISHRRLVISARSNPLATSHLSPGLDKGHFHVDIIATKEQVEHQLGSKKRSYESLKLAMTFTPYHTDIHFNPNRRLGRLTPCCTRLGWRHILGKFIRFADPHLWKL